MTRHDEGSPKPVVRGEPIVRRVMRAALGELARGGYDGFRIENVALRARVNKTTIYRRWPTTETLVCAALSSVTAAVPVAPGKGSLRSALLAGARAFADVATTPAGRSIIRVLASKSEHPKVADIIRTLRGQLESLIAEGISRYALAADADPVLLAQTVGGAIVQRGVFMNEDVTDSYLGALVDLLLYGAAPPAMREGRAAHGSRAR